MVLLDLPDGIKHVGYLKDYDGENGIVNPELFDRYMQTLRDMSLRNTLDRIKPNGGSGGAPYFYQETPRIFVKDTQGNLEILVEAYGPTPLRAAFIHFYSGEVNRTEAILKQYFSPKEFEPTPFALKIEVSVTKLE